MFLEVPISAFSIYGSDMWDGDSNDNAYWKQTTSVSNSGTVELGYFLASGDYNPGKVTDGLAANSTSTPSVNALNVGGDSGSSVILDDANTFTGSTTVNANATAIAKNAQAFGTTAGGVTVTSGGRIQLNGGVSIGTEALTLNGTGISGSGALQNTGGNNTWGGAITLASATRINSDSGTLTLDVSSGNAIAGSQDLTLGGAGDITINDPIATGTGTLTKDGSGTLTLSNTNTYTGATEVKAGTLVVNGNQSGATGKVTVASGAMLAGTGTVGGATTVNGTLAPTATAGNSGDPLAFSSTLAFDSGTTDLFSWTLNAATTDPGNSSNQGTYGQVAVTGAVSGTSVFTVVLGTNAFTDVFWNTNKSWTNVFSASGLENLSNVFTNFGGTGVATNGVVSGQGSFAFSGTTLNWTPVPELSNLLIGGLLGAGLLLRRRAEGRAAAQC